MVVAGALLIGIGFLTLFRTRNTVDLVRFDILHRIQTGSRDQETVFMFFHKKIIEHEEIKYFQMQRKED